jgi:hypothetical protein
MILKLEGTLQTLCKIRNRKQGIILHKGSAMTKEKILKNIDFKELSSQS